MSDFLEQTGYSYSGISDIIHNQPEHAKGLILEINREYQAAKTKMEELQKELDSLAYQRGLLVSSFMYAHKALNLGEKPLCFISDNSTVVVEMRSENKINYEVYPHTELTA